jgi:hypothetical protein
MAVADPVAVPGGSSVAVTVTLKVPARSYVCEPVTVNGPPVGPVTVPGVVVLPSPQSMVVAKFVERATGFVSVKVATIPEKGSFGPRGER